MSINDPNFLKEVKKKIDETDWDSVFKREREELAQGQLRVANKTYCNWLTSFLDDLKQPYDDESYAYKTLKCKRELTEEDDKNEKDLSHFHKFLHIVADIQRVKEYFDDRDGFPEYEYVWKYQNRFFEWNTIVGQGSITRISKIEKPDFAYIDLDLYFQREEEGNPQKKFKPSYWDSYDDDIDEDDDDLSDKFFS